MARHRLAAQRVRPAASLNLGSVRVKIGVQVVVSLHSIVLHVPEAFPDQLSLHRPSLEFGYPTEVSFPLFRFRS
jgi:hypothetical protein